MQDDNGQSQTTRRDPWRGIKRGDRFWIIGWNVREDAQLWEEVTDLWFDPVRGQSNPKRGYVVAIRLMGAGRKRMLAASTLAGKGYRRVLPVDVSGWMERLPSTEPLYRREHRERGEMHDA